jgi:hypothetical protein
MISRTQEPWDKYPSKNTRTREPDNKTKQAEIGFFLALAPLPTWLRLKMCRFLQAACN